MTNRRTEIIEIIASSINVPHSRHIWAENVYDTLVEHGIIDNDDDEITGFDHVAIAVWNIEKWTERYTARGAVVTYDNPDACPEGPSSMHLRGFRWGKFRFVLIMPINRQEESQVSVFLRKHNDHAFQHIAVGVKNLEDFVAKMQALNTNFIREINERPDAFGPVRQIFGRIFDAELSPDEGNFWEFTERPQSITESSTADVEHKDFDDNMAEHLYKQLEEATKDMEFLPFIE